LGLACPLSLSTGVPLASYLGNNAVVLIVRMSTA